MYVKVFQLFYRLGNINFRWFIHLFFKILKKYSFKFQLYLNSVFHNFS